MLDLLQSLSRRRLPHLGEEVSHGRVHDQQDTTTRTQSQHLGDETLVQRRRALLPGNSGHRTPGPVVLGRLARDLGRVLDPRLDHVHGGVETGTDRATDRTADQVRHHLSLLGVRLGKQRLDLEDTPEVTRVPEDVSPERGFQPVVHGQDALVLDDLGHHINHAIVFARGGLVLQPDLDQLEGHDDEGLGGAGAGSREDGEALGLLCLAEGVAVELTPAVVGGELDGTLGGFHEDGRRDAAVEPVEALVLDDLLEAVQHAGVVVGGTGDGGAGLELHSRLDYIERVPEEIIGQMEGRERVEEIGGKRTSTGFPTHRQWRLVAHMGQYEGALCVSERISEVHTGCEGVPEGEGGLF